MSQLNESSTLLEKITGSGLVVQYAGTSGPFAEGYLIAKPQSIEGNSRDGYKTLFGSDKIACDAPCVQLYPLDDQWLVEVWEYMPGPGPGDFQEKFLEFNNAVSFVLDYYFGSPETMNPPELNS